MTTGGPLRGPTEPLPGRDRLLKVAEVAEHLGVSNATVYGLCERGELPYVWVVTSMRVRPRDDAGPTTGPGRVPRVAVDDRGDTPPA